MGTPEFAVASLQAILEAGFPVAAVVTAADKPSGRGRRLQSSPVKQFALKRGLTVLQPLNLKDPAFLDALGNLKADLQVVVAFRMIPEAVWKMPPLGTFNLHASLLPDYRGAAPINWVIINGEKKTGVTTFFIDHEIDKGSVIYQEETVILPEEDAGMLHDRLMVMGAGLVVRTIRSLAAGKVIPVDQSRIPHQGMLHPAPRIHHGDCRINWSLPAEKTANLVRGLSPHPGAWTMATCNGKNQQVVKILAATAVLKDHDKPAGTVETDQKKQLWIATPDGYLSVTSLQLQGRKKMGTGDFLRGFHGIGNCTFR